MKLLTKDLETIEFFHSSYDFYTEALCVSPLKNVGEEAVKCNASIMIGALSIYAILKCGKNSYEWTRSEYNVLLDIAFGGELPVESDEDAANASFSLFSKLVSDDMWVYTCQQAHLMG